MSSPSGAFFLLRCLIYKVHAVPGGTLLLYVASSRLSRTFFKSFLTSGPPRICGNSLNLPHFSFAVKYFFLFPSGAAPAPPTALLEYQISLVLSMGNYNFFQKSPYIGFGPQRRPSRQAFIAVQTQVCSVAATAFLCILSCNCWHISFPIAPACA